VSVKAGCNLRTGPLYWKTLFTVLAVNPKAAEAAISMAALYIHFDAQAQYVIERLQREIAEIDERGEQDYHAQMIDAGRLSVDRSLNGLQSA
jgi:hypothetical protein